MKKCPFCAEEIQDAAVKCKHCGSMLTEAPPAPVLVPPPVVASAPQQASAAGCASIVGGFLVLLLIVGVINSVVNPYFQWSDLLFFMSTSSGRPASRTVEPAASTQPPPAPAHAQNPALAESARAAVSKMVNLGLIKRMDVRTGKFYIDGPLWEGFELDGKESIVKTISGYREAEYKGLPQVTLYESRSGKELANYGAFSGVTIK